MPETSYNFTVLYTSVEEGGYIVTCPALPGLDTEGDTIDEARAMAKDAIELYLKSLLADGLPIPLDPITSRSVTVVESSTVTFNTDWECKQCGNSNEANVKNCVNCGEGRPTI